MKVKQLDCLAKIVDKGNEILSAIEDLEIALDLINNYPKTQVSVAVSDQEYIIQISDHISFSKDLWRELINAEIKRLRKDFKQLRIR